MKQIIYFSVIIFLFSCTVKNRFPEPVSEKVPLELVKIPGKLKLSYPDSNMASEQNSFSTQDFGQLLQLQDMYLKKDTEFSLTDFENEWTEINSKIDHSELNLSDAEKWFTINGTLLEITGDAKYGETMQKTLLRGFHPQNEAEYKIIENLVAPYIFTKNVDHIHINLFTSAEIEYEHTLHGNVNIRQETNFPESEDITVNFSMEEHRYVEVFIRIPSWADGATVTAMGVKYFAPPGDYAFIAKRWNDGDVIKIHFPKKKKIAGL